MDPRLEDLQRCNEALGRKWQILKTAMEGIAKGSPFSADIAQASLNEQAGIGVDLSLVFGSQDGS